MSRACAPPRLPGARGSRGADTGRPSSRGADAIPDTLRVRGALAFLGIIAFPGVLAFLAAPAGAAAQENGAVPPEPRRERPPRTVALDEAIRIGLRNNPSLRQADASVEQAEFDRLASYGSFLPDLDLGYGFSDASTGRLDPTGQSITRTSWTMQLTGSIQVFDGLRRVNDLTRARRSVAAERATRRETRFETILDVKQAFYDAVATREIVRVEEDRVERQREQLELVRQQLEVGGANRSDLLRSRVDLNTARLDAINARNEARAATFRLAEAMGVRERVAPVEEARLRVGPLPYDRERLERIALRQSPAVVAARRSAEAARAEVDAAKSSYLPSLQFQGGWAWQNSEFPPTDRSWSIGLQGNMPIFNGFRRETEVFQAQARADAARSRENEAVLALRSRLDDAFSQIESALEAVDLARQSVELSREDLVVSRERFRLGLATILDLQAAQIALEQAEVDLVQRNFDYLIGVARLEAVLGTELVELEPTSGGGPGTGGGDPAGSLTGGGR